MEKYTMLGLSTGHVTEATAKMLDNEDLSIVVYPKSEYGWFVHVPTYEPDFEDCKTDLPEDLRACLDWARKHNAEWLMFDRDAELDEELPVYDW